MLSSPASRRNPSRGTRPWADAGLPECLRQREQWQKFARRNAIVISKRTAPPRQLPGSGLSELGAMHKMISLRRRFSVPPAAGHAEHAIALAWRRHLAEGQPESSARA